MGSISIFFLNLVIITSIDLSLSSSINCPISSLVKVFPGLTPCHELSDAQLTEAMGVGLAMIGLFELLNDDDDGIYDDVKEALEDKVERLLADNQVPQVAEPTYTAEGNVLRLNAFTRTKGSC